MFSNIGIFAKREDPQIEQALKQLHKYLLDKDKQVFVDQFAKPFIDATCLSHDEMIETIDLAITVGGDGTLLHAGRHLVTANIPIVGVNLGRLGFLADVSPDNIDQLLDDIFSGDYIEEKRLLLKASVYRKEECLGEGLALNDVVMHVRQEIRMIEFVTHINGKFVNQQRADGIVVATPTGSTAYALSGGGPILHPELEAVVLVPICPHTLSHRPIAVTANDTIEINLCDDRRNPEGRISFDGQNNIEIEPGDCVTISSCKQRLRLLHPSNYDYYQILRSKLHWSIQP